MSIIARMIEKIYGKQEMRALMVGLDASGRTTALYMLKMGERITTIPTIGFNVETVEHNGVAFTAWDVGGCDKIRPLWRHYFQNTMVLMMFVDSADHTRMPEAADELQRMLMEDELKDVVVVVLANKQDLPNAASPKQVEEVMRLKETKHLCTCIGTVATTGEGLYEALDWAASAVKEQQAHGVVQKEEPTRSLLASMLGGLLVKESPEKLEVKRREKEMEELLEKWLEQEDEPDEEFLHNFRECKLESWDHRTHLRIAWLILIRDGRQKGLPMIFDGIKNFIAKSPRTQRSRGTTFHETMTYFWVHMVHYAIVTTHNPNDEFKTFLLLNPQLANGGMFLAYYTKKLMLNTSEARTTVVLPDKRPLPSLISNVSTSAKESGRGQVQPMATELSQRQSTGSTGPDDDDDFLKRFEAGNLDRWNHECLLRVVYLYLAKKGRRLGKDKVFEQLRRHEGSGFHFTIAYFWIQTVSFAIAEQRSTAKGLDATTSKPDLQPSHIDKVVPFCLFVHRLQESASKVEGGLTDAQFYLQYYSKKAVYSDVAAMEMVLPDLKPLPSLVL